MFATQVEAYKRTQKSTMSGREIEASVLTQAAIKLLNCQDRWGTEGHEARIDEALRFNQLIWSIFQGELSKPDNPLPKKVREDLLSLSVFIDKRIFEVMAYPESDKITILININLNLAAGLKGSSQ
jgi:flagellar biosynthesis activator protein FlaF